MTEVMDLILKRRSIRKYTDAPVSAEQVEILLRAAMAAPSANNKQPWRFIVVRDPEKRKALSKVHKWSGMCAGAALVVVVLGDPDVSSFWVEDCSAATENLLLAAADLGLGGVWVAVSPDSFDEASVRSILNIPETFRVFCLVPLGYPAETKSPRTQYDAGKVHFEVF